MTAITHPFNDLLASTIHDALATRKSGQRRHETVYFDEVAGTMADFVRAAEANGLRVEWSDSDAAVLRLA